MNGDLAVWHHILMMGKSFNFLVKGGHNSNKNCYSTDKVVFGIQLMIAVRENAPRIDPVPLEKDRVSMIQNVKQQAHTMFVQIIVLTGKSNTMQ